MVNIMIVGYWWEKWKIFQCLQSGSIPECRMQYYYNRFNSDGYIVMLISILVSGRYGVCYTSTECTSLGGSAAGSCASGFGVCCSFNSKCGDSINLNNTYFTNTDSDSSPCSVKVCKTSSDICQIRWKKQCIAMVTLIIIAFYTTGSTLTHFNWVNHPRSTQEMETPAAEGLVSRQGSLLRVMVPVLLSFVEQTQVRC